jgi:TrmH family RNA methyltransferase
VKLLTLARDLQRRKGRERRGLFVAEGVRSAEEIVRATVQITGALVTPELTKSDRGRNLREALDSRAVEIAEVSDRELASAAGTDTPQGVIVIAGVPDYSLSTLRLPSASRLLLLDGVQDPGNAGALVRTAAALGGAAVIALPGTVDLWSPKVVRGAMGAHFQVPTLHADSDETLGFLADRVIELWVAAADGQPPESLSPPSALALVVGNEGAGVSAAWRRRAQVSVGLTLTAGVESLNVAVAAGILLYELRDRVAQS